ncbi:MAG TPA: hypothetical protein VE994_09090 [Terriglobales bacterium]|nr:hypothetical protein [Terriglobales bacterium]
MNSFLKFMCTLLLLATIAGAQTGEQVSATPGSSQSNLTEGSAANGQHTIVVDVWSSAVQPPPKPKKEDPARLSRGFAVAASDAASRLQFTERRITNSIRMGFPLGGGFWIQTDLDAVDDSLRLAALSATNQADEQVLQQLQTQTDRLRAWCGWLIEQNRTLRLANYFISPEPLDNDMEYQNTVTCTRFLLSMVGRGRLEQEDRSCR